MDFPSKRLRLFRINNELFNTKRKILHAPHKPSFNRTGSYKFSSYQKEISTQRESQPASQPTMIPPPPLPHSVGVIDIELLKKAQKRTAAKKEERRRGEKVFFLAVQTI
jgi:hypothetical protein